MGVASGMPANPQWLPLLVDELPLGAPWQVIAIGREEVWPLLTRCAELGGNVRTGLEDTFYLPDGSRATSRYTITHIHPRLCLWMIFNSMISVGS